MVLQTLCIRKNGYNTLVAQNEDDERMCFLPLCHIAERVGGDPEQIHELLYGAAPRTDAELVALAKAQPGKITFGSWGIGIGTDIGAGPAGSAAANSSISTRWTAPTSR